MQRAVSLALSLVLLVLPAVEAAAHGSHGHFERPAPLPATALPVEAAAIPAPPGAEAAAASDPAAAADPAAVLDPAAAAQAAATPLAAASEAAHEDEHVHDHDEHDHSHSRDAPASVDGAALFDGQAPRRGIIDAVWSTLRYPSVVRAVDEVLDHSLAPERRVAAARRLARLRRPETAAALATVSRDRDPQVAQAARDALLVIAPGAAKPAALTYQAQPQDFESARRPVHLAALKRVVTVAAIFTAIEAVGSWLTGSVSLQADAMHLTADLMINVATLYAASAAVSGRGSLKLEPMIGLVSAVAIAGMGAFAGVEAVGRLLHPAAVPALQTMLLALSGLTSNALSTAMLYRFRGDSLSLRGAFLHAATDALGSVGIIVAGGLILAFGWLWADPLITFAIVALIARTTWDLGRSAWSVLMDAVPQDIDLAEMERELLATTGASRVDDLRVWAVSSMERAGTARLRVKPGTSHEAALRAAKAIFARWHVARSTVEITQG